MRSFTWLGTLVFAFVACPGPSTRRPGMPEQGDLPAVPNIVESAYASALVGSWRESGFALRDVNMRGPASVQFVDSGKWTLTHTGLAGRYGSLVFRVKEPEGEGEFLQIRLGSEAAHTFRAVKLEPDHCSPLPSGWTQVRVPMTELDPDGASFDSITFEAFRPFAGKWVFFDQIALTAAEGVAEPVQSAPAASASKNASVAPPDAAASQSEKLTRIRVVCDASATRISPFIYGIAGSGDDAAALGAKARRWGGNPTSRYNWEANVWNTAQDWFFENHTAPSYDDFLTENVARGVLGAVTVPMIGWVAKDGTSYSFPVSVFGPQTATDQWHSDAGSGVTPSGEKITPGSPTRTSVSAPPEWAKRWVAAIVAHDAKRGQRSVYEYILDNEPMLWSSTHRDVHPQPLGYDELLDRSIRYASAIRSADPEALIAGPAEWGWSGYLYSAKDLIGHSGLHPDRREHEDIPLVEWYLRSMREAERKSGHRLLDILDLHYYPQADNVYGNGTGGTDRQTQLLRLRSTRSLWDPSYTDESWIKEPIRLLPRMRDWVDKNYPGRGISIGEWNFGGQNDITGALSTAEALGRFAEFGVTSAFYWTTPPQGSPSRLGFLAYRNFDGRGGHFLDWFVPSKSPDGVSVFASRDQNGKHLVVIALNMGPDTPLDAVLDLRTCGTVSDHEAYTYSSLSAGFVGATPVQDHAAMLYEVLAPWSITVLDIHMTADGDAK